MVNTPKRTSESLSKLMAPSSHYPLLVNPNTKGSSKGIDSFNKVHDPAELKQAVQSAPWNPSCQAGNSQWAFWGQELIVE